jgi:hypothetical protein
MCAAKASGLFCLDILLCYSSIKNPKEGVTKLKIQNCEKWGDSADFEKMD